MPTCIMKFRPFVRASRSFEGSMPSRMEGVVDSSVSVKSHWALASCRICDGDLGTGVVCECDWDWDWPLGTDGILIVDFDFVDDGMWI